MQTLLVFALMLFLFYFYRFFNVTDLSKSLYGGTYAFRVFVDLKTANAETPLADPHFAGSITVVARELNTPCLSCKANNIKVRGSVNLTNAMYRLGILVNPEQIGDSLAVNTPEVGFGHSRTFVLYCICVALF